MQDEVIIKEELLPESHLDAYDALSLTDGKLRDLGERLKARYDELSSMRERSMWERDKALAFESYHMMEKIKDLPYPGYPNLASILPRIGIDSFHANVMQSLFGNGFRDLVTPRYMNPQFVRQAKKGAQFLSYQLEQECNFYRVMDDADAKAQTYGIAFIEVYYVKEYEWQTARVTKRSIESGEETSKIEKRRKTLFDGIRMESLPVDSVIVSPFYRDIKTAVKNDVVMKKFKRTWDQLLFSCRPDPETKKSFYNKTQVEQLKLYCVDKYYAKDWDELTRKRVQYDGFFLDQMLSPKSVDLVEAHFWEDIDGDGIQEKVVVTFNPDSGVVIRVSLGKCRIVELRPRPVDERFYGDGIPRLCRHLDTEWEAIHNARVAKGQWEHTPFGFYKAGGRFNPTEITIIPGHFYPVDSPQDVMFAQNPVVERSFYQEEQLLFNYFERIFGLSENLQGISASREQTATENISVANKSMIRFSNPFTRIVMSVEDLLEHMWDLNRACAPESKEFYVVGIGPVPMFSKMSKKDYAASLDFKINVKTVFDEQMVRDTALLVYNTLLPNPLVNQHPGAMYDLVNNLLEAVNYKLNLPVPPEAKTLNPMEEHEMFLEGDDPEPQVGEDIEEHLQYHMAFIKTDEIREWPNEAIQRLMVHIDKTKILQQTLQQANLNQSGQFGGMPSPMAPGVKANPLTLSRNPSDTMNRMRSSQAPGSQVNNAKTTPAQVTPPQPAQ